MLVFAERHIVENEKNMWAHVWSIADKPSSVNVACNVRHMAESDSHCWT